MIEKLIECLNEIREEQVIIEIDSMIGYKGRYINDFSGLSGEENGGREDRKKGRKDIRLKCEKSIPDEVRCTNDFSRII